MPEILNLLAPLLLGSKNRENLPKRVKKKRSNFDCAGKKNKTKTNKQKNLFQNVAAVSLV
jgi:Na+/H+ antiporter NhaB